MLVRKLLNFFKKVFALFLFLFNPRKQAIEHNLERLGVEHHKGRLAFQTYYNLFNAYLMLLIYTLFKKRPLFTIYNEDYLKTGKIFVSIHYGPWDLALRLVYEKYPFVSVVGKRDFLNVLREKQGIRLIYSTDGFLKIAELAKKERMAIMLDRTFYEKGIFIPVGKSKLKISRAAIMLARRTKQDIFFIRTVGKDDTISLYIEKIPCDSFESMLKGVSDMINRTVLDDPSWWLNFFTTWKK